MADDRILPIKNDEALRHFFSEQLANSLRRSRTPISEEMEIYLCSVLAKFYHGPSVVRLLRFFDEPIIPCVIVPIRSGFVDRENYRMLVDVGEFTLMITGFHWNRFVHSALDINYYYAIGAAVYSLAAKYRKCVHKETFGVLALRFPQIAAILMDIRLHLNTGPLSDRDIFNMIETCFKTGDENVRRALIEQGVDTAMISALSTTKIWTDK